MPQNDEIKCIICGSEPNNNPETAITFEHIIPESLGNHSFGGCFLCKKCNEKLGELVDAKLCNNSIVASMRLYFDLAGKSGGYPKLQGKVGDIENAIIINGELKLPSYLKEVEDGKFRGNAATINEAITMTTKALQRRGYDNETIERTLSDIKKSAPIQIKDPIFTTDLTFDKKELDLSFIKIAYEYAFVKLGTKYQDDVIGILLRKILFSFINGCGDIQLLNSPPIIDIFWVINNDLRQKNVSKELYGHYHAKYFNECFKFKGMPAHAMRIKKLNNESLAAEIVLFCHPFFHYIVPITLTSGLYNFNEDVDYIICYTVDDEEELKSILKENESAIFGFPPMTISKEEKN